MASSTNMAMRRLASAGMRPSTLRTSPSPAAPRCLRVSRAYSTDTADAPPPLLSKLKADLKTAMRAKDAPRLSILRNILAATNNAAKTSAPIKNDGQLISLMLKTMRGNQEAREEALKAGRQDLVDKEEAQIKVVEEYIAGSGIRVVGEDELRVTVEEVVGVAKVGERKQGELMKELMSKDWSKEGRYVDKNALAKLVREAWDKK